MPQIVDDDNRTYDDSGLPPEDPDGSDAGVQALPEDGGLDPRGSDASNLPPNSDAAIDPDPMDPMEGTGTGGGTDDGGISERPPLERRKVAFACPARTRDTLEANEEWVADRLAEDTILAAGTRYYLDHELVIDNVALTLEAGTTLCLGSEGFLLVGKDEPGTIDVQGTLDSPVTITAVEVNGEPGFHRGLAINRHVSSAISHLDIWYGGQWDLAQGGALAFGIGADAPSDTALHIDHLTIGEVTGPAIIVVSDAGFTEDSVIQVLGMRDGFGPPEQEGGEVGLLPALPLAILGMYAATNATAETLSINFESVPEAQRRIWLFPPQDNVLTQDSELHDLGAPFITFGDIVVRNVTWTIHAGTNLVMDGTILVDTFVPLRRRDAEFGERILFQPPVYGNLVVAGTAEEPVVIRGHSDDPGSWGGIYFMGGKFNPAVSSLSHVHLLSAGSGYYGVQACSEERYGAIAIGGSGNFEGPSMDSVTIRDSASSCLAASFEYGDVGTELITDYDGDITCQDSAGPAFDISGDGCPPVIAYPVQDGDL